MLNSLIRVNRTINKGNRNILSMRMWS